MKNTRFLELMNGIDTDLLERAGKPKKPKINKKIWVSAIAACLALCITVGAVIGGLFGSPVGITEKDGFNIARAVYPDGDVDMALFYDYYAEHGGIESFYKASIAEMLKTDEGENIVYSPANLYMELAMLAEMTGGESREQILALLGEQDIEAVRKTANALWSLSYVPGEEGTTLMANSVWLNEYYDKILNGKTLGTLAKLYRASSYSGNFEEPAYIDAMKEWTHAQTNGFLRDMEMDWEPDENTLLSFISTIYFKDGWEYTFDNTRSMTFYITDEESVKCDFLIDDKADVIAYGGENFIAVEKTFGQGGSMLFVLPDRGYTTDDLLSDEEFMDFIASPAEFANQSSDTRDIRIPAFDIAAEGDISEKLQSLGVTDVFNSATADFTPLADSREISLSEIKQGVRIRIDEEGCEAAGCVQGDIALGSPAIPRLIKFDRPFIFAVLTEEGIPLFTGIVNDPTLS